MSRVGLITKKKFRKIAISILDFLNEKKIDSIKNLEGMFEESFKIKKETNLFIYVGLESSESDGKVYTIKYVDCDKGIPFEIRMNPKFNYSKIIVKTDSGLEDYISFDSDSFGNFIQNKRIGGCSIPEIKEELEQLISNQNPFI